MHELDGGGFHHHSDHDNPDYSELDDLLYQLDNVELTTIGVDVGSSTFHLLFSKVHLQREAQRLSSKFEVVEREVLWRSGIRLTPYRGRRIDADAVSQFVAACHDEAGLAPGEVDSGAVILTGEALRQQNARALADGIAAGSGKFVCVSAGHHLESMLAAHGSGAAAYSEETGTRLFHIDIGGGTTKLSLIEEGQVRATAALMVGGRQVAWNDRREIVSTTAGARTIAHAAGVDISLGNRFSPADEKRFVAAQAEVIFAIAAQHSDPLGRKLRLTRVLPTPFEADAVSFSGGVSEYVYGREENDYGDLGAALGRALRAGVDAGRIALPLVDPGEGIRATVVGASQCSVQLSGNTVTVSDAAILPIHNVPVVHPVPRSANGDLPGPDELANAIKEAVSVHGLTMEDPVALAFNWRGEPSYQRMSAFSRGVQQAVNVVSSSPVLVLMDDDVGRSVGRLLISEFPVDRPLICLDGLDLSPLDYVDVGTILEPSGALPVVIKSLLFGAGS